MPILRVYSLFPATCVGLMAGIVGCGEGPRGEKGENRPSAAADDHIQMVDRDRFIIRRADNIQGYIDRQGRVVLEPRYRFVNNFFDGVAIVQEQSGGTSQYVDRNGDVIYPTETTRTSIGTTAPTQLDHFREGLGLVGVFRKDGSSRGGHMGYDYRSFTYGFIDATGRMVIEPKFALAGSFSEELAPAKEDTPEGLWGYIDKSGKYKISPQFGDTGRRILLDHYQDKDGVLRMSGTPRNFRGGLAAVPVDRKLGFIDTSGKMVIASNYSEVWDFSCGRAKVKEGERSFFIDSKGQQVFDASSAVDHYFRDGLVLVRQDGKHGYMDVSGEIVIPCQYEWAQGFSEGLAPVSVNGLWGYIDRKGKTVIEPQFKLAEPFAGGLAAVNARRDLVSHWDETSGYIDTSGKYVWQFGKE